jgi:hypothetical protein
MTNTDKIVEYILKNVKDLPPDQIRAMAEVIRSLGGEIEKIPNTIPVKNEPSLLEDDEPIDLSEVEGLVIDGQEKPIKIY